MKKLRVITLSALFLCGLLTGAWASPVFTEDFNDLEAVSVSELTALGLGQVIADGRWISKPMLTANDGMGDSHAAKFGIAFDTAGGNNRALVIEAAATWNNHVMTPVVYSTQNMMRTDGAYRISARIRTDNWQAGAGLRFMVHNGGKNYYELFFADNNAQSSGKWRMVKFQGNALTNAWMIDAATMQIASQSVFSKTLAQMQGNNWYQVEVTVDRGVISFRGSSSAGAQYELTTVTDADPFAPSDATLGFFATGDRGYYGFFDDISVSRYEPYIDSGAEKDNALYLTLEAAADAQGTVDLGGAYRVRRLRAPALAGESADISFSADAQSPGESGTLLLDAAGQGINTVTASPARILRFSQNPGVVQVDAELTTGEPIVVTIGNAFPLTLRYHGAQASGVQWGAGDAGVIRVEEGALRSYKNGSSVLQAQKAGLGYRIPVTVKGEIARAQETGRIAEYLQEKKPVVDAVNGAIAARDSDRLLSVIQGDPSRADALQNIRDLDYAAIAALTPEEAGRLARSILTYPAFPLTSAQDMLNLIDAFEGETQLQTLYMLATGQEVRDALLLGGCCFEIDLENKYFLLKEEQVYAAMTQQDFESLSRMRGYFQQQYILLNLRDTISSVFVSELIRDCQAQIGYDKARFQSLSSKQGLYAKLLEQKASIASLGDLKAVIDSYAPPAGGGGGTGGGGGGASGGAAKPKAVTIDDTLIREQKEARQSLTSPYHDLGESHWAFEEIVRLTARKVFNGYEGGFDPEREMTVAEFIKAVVGAFGFGPPEDGFGEEFADVSPGAWYYEAAKTARANGLADGDGENRLLPQAPVTRERAAAILYRAMSKKGIVIESRQAPVIFTDADEISDWSHAAVARLQSGGILSGMPDGSFRPAGRLTRAQAAKLLGAAVVQ